jgi:hypothetical protein
MNVYKLKEIVDELIEKRLGPAEVTVGPYPSSEDFTIRPDSHNVNRVRIIPIKNKDD